MDSAIICIGMSVRQVSAEQCMVVLALVGSSSFLGFVSNFSSDNFL